MYKSILLVFSFFLILGCSGAKERNLKQLFNRDEIYHKSLLNTQKAQLIASFETKALMTATYLNPVFGNNKYKNLSIDVSGGEWFFIGVYISGSKTNKFNEKGYYLTLNGNEPIEIKKLDKDDPLKYEMPMVDNWSTYYKVKFPTVHSKKLKLVFGSDRFGEDIMIFRKRKLK